MINGTTFPTTIPDALYYDIYRTNSLTDWSQDWESFCDEEFAFWGPEFAYHFPKGFEDWIANWDSIPGGGGDCRYKQRHDCPVSMNHVTHQWVDEVDSIQMEGAGPLTPLVQSYAGNNPCLLITETLAEQLRAAKLDGLIIKEASVMNDYDPGYHHRYAADPERTGERFFFLAGPNPLLTMPPVLDSEAPNACPSCGYGPIVCPRCGYIGDAWCSQCGVQMYNADSPPEVAAKQVDIASIYAPEEHQQANGAIDLARCDTLWDFSGTSRVSRKMLDVLIGLDAGPMLVVPVKVLFPDGSIGYTERDAKPPIPLRQP